MFHIRSANYKLFFTLFLKIVCPGGGCIIRNMNYCVLSRSPTHFTFRVDCVCFDDLKDTKITYTWKKKNKTKTERLLLAVKFEWHASVIFNDDGGDDTVCIVLKLVWKRVPVFIGVRLWFRLCSRARTPPVTPTREILLYYYCILYYVEINCNEINDGNLIFPETCVAGDGIHLFDSEFILF